MRHCQFSLPEGFFSSHPVGFIKAFVFKFKVFTASNLKGEIRPGFLWLGWSGNKPPQSSPGNCPLLRNQSWPEMSLANRFKVFSSQREALSRCSLHEPAGGACFPALVISHTCKQPIRFLTHICLVTNWLHYCCLVISGKNKSFFHDSPGFIIKMI